MYMYVHIIFAYIKRFSNDAKLEREYWRRLPLTDNGWRTALRRNTTYYFTISDVVEEQETPKSPIYSYSTEGKLELHQSPIYSYSTKGMLGLHQSPSVATLEKAY